MASSLLEELFILAGDLSPESAAAAKVRVLARVRELTSDEQVRVRGEATVARDACSPGNSAWQVCQLMVQCLWHVTHVKAEETPEQRALRQQMDRTYAERNGDWYTAGTWLSAEEAGERIKQRTI
jgi:hypothetical protein